MSTPDNHPYASLSPEQLLEGFKAANSFNGKRGYFEFILKVQAGDPTFLQRFTHLAVEDEAVLWEVHKLFLDAPASSSLIDSFHQLIEYAFAQEEAGSNGSPEIIRKGLYWRLQSYREWGDQLAPFLLKALEREQWVNEPLDELINAIIITGRSSWGLYLSAFKAACSNQDNDIRDYTPTSRVINGLSRALLGMGAPIDQIVPLIPKPPKKGGFRLW